MHQTYFADTYQFLHGLQSVLWVFYSVGINEIIVFICRKGRHMITYNERVTLPKCQH